MNDKNDKSTIHVILLLWSSFHDAILHATHVEKHFEALLLQLVQASKYDLKATTWEQYESLFFIIKPCKPTNFHLKPHTSPSCADAAYPPPMSFPTPCPSPPLVLPWEGVGDRHLVNPKFFVAAHYVVVLLCG